MAGVVRLHYRLRRGVVRCTVSVWAGDDSAHRRELHNEHLRDDRR